MPSVQSASDKPTRKSPKTPSPRAADAPVADPLDEAGSFSELKALLAGHLKPEDVERVELAFSVAQSAHEGQFRQSGAAYITHPLAVAHILAGWHLDATALIAALLHDVVEDTRTTKTEISKQFGKAVANLVDGVSKIDRLKFETLEQAQAENFRKMLLAMARDVRVILIKLADRLHNMRTLDAVSQDKQERIARETLEIYSPIANRLGLNDVYFEFEDLGFRYLHPHRFRVLEKAVKSARGNRRELVGKMLESIQLRLKEQGIEASISGREKHLSSIHKKMQEKSLTFSEVLDVYGFRIVVKDVPSCYLALGAMHTLYKPRPGKFKDYIAIPKPNGYQSLHTALFGPFGVPIELQIRSHEMHKIAEAGVASHWLYKSSEASVNEMQQKTHQWLQSLLELQSGSGDALEFLEHIKVDLFPDQVYLFSPKGKIIALPKGSTSIDYAYSVHTDVGNHAMSAKVNDEDVPLGTRLRNGDRVEIITAPEGRPNPAWLSFAATGRARSHIRHYLKNTHFAESVELGELLLIQGVRALQLDPHELGKLHWEHMLKGDSAKTKEEVLADIGLGKRLALVVARKLFSVVEDAEHRGARPLEPLTIRGSEGMAVQFSSCCRPIPGDPIIAQINKGAGLIVHTHDCPAIHPFKFDPEKWVDVQWDPGLDKAFKVLIKVTVTDKRGVLAKIAAEIASADSNIAHIQMSDKQEGETVYTDLMLDLEVRHRMHLANVLRQLRRLPEVVRIARVKSSSHSQSNNH